MRFTSKSFLLYNAHLKKCFFTLDAVNSSASVLFICPSLLFPASLFFFFCSRSLLLLRFSSDLNHSYVPHTSLKREWTDERQWEITWPHLIHSCSISDFLVTGSVLFWACGWDPPQQHENGSTISVFVVRAESEDDDTLLTWISVFVAHKLDLENTTTDLFSTVHF